MKNTYRLQYVRKGQLDYPNAELKEGLSVRQKFYYFKRKFKEGAHEALAHWMS